MTEDNTSRFGDDDLEHLRKMLNFGQIGLRTSFWI